MKQKIKELSSIKPVSDIFWRWRNKRAGNISESFWKTRYETEGTSGPGSYGRLADFKTSMINKTVDEYSITSVIDFGCGDGNQITKIRPVAYLGIDISSDSVARCKAMYSCDANKKFITSKEYVDQSAEMATSLDVIFHLVEDPVFHVYMNNLFNSARRFVLIYSSNFDQRCLNPWAGPTHVRHREFLRWIVDNRPEWGLVKHIENPYKWEPGKTSRAHSRSEFFLFSRAITLEQR